MTNKTTDVFEFLANTKDLSTKGIAERAGMNQSLLTQYVNGRRVPSDKQRERVTKALTELIKEIYAVTANPFVG
jgi:transcriptional regulator with XRE-family HTH domain